MSIVYNNPKNPMNLDDFYQTQEYRYYGQNDSFFFPPCFVCGELATNVCASKQCELPAFLCEEECIINHRQGVHQHQTRNISGCSLLASTIEDMENKREYRIYYKYLKDVRNRLVQMRHLFLDIYYAHEKKITRGFALKVKEGCEGLYQKIKAKNYDGVTGREVGVFLEGSSCRYEDQSAVKIIEHEKKKFQGVLVSVEKMMKEYMKGESLREQHERGLGLLGEGTGFMQEQQWEEAIEKYLQAEQFLVETDQVFLLAGQCFKEIQKYAEAKTQYLKCIEMSPHNIEALQNIAEICTIQKEYSESVGYYGTLIQVNKKQSQYYFKRGKMYVKAKQLKNALLDFTKACQLESGNEEYHEHKRRTMLELADAGDSSQEP